MEKLKTTDVIEDVTLAVQQPAVQVGGAGTIDERAAKKAAAAKKKRRKKKIKATIIWVLVLLAVAGTGYGMYSLFHEEEVVQEPWSEAAYRGSISSIVTGYGESKAKAAESLTLTDGGLVKEVFVTQGQMVVAGDPLYVVDSEKAQAAVKTAQEAIDDIQRQIGNINKEYSNLSLSAPFAGKIIECEDIKVGDTVGVGTKLATLVDDKTMKLSLYFSYAYESEFAVGKAATISIPSSMNLLNGSVVEINKINRVSPEGSKLFEVVFSVANPGTLAKDMGATAYLTGSSGEEIYPYEPGKLEYNRSQELVTKAGGEVLSSNLLNYADMGSWSTVITLKGDDTADQLATLNASMKVAQETMETAKKALNNYQAFAPISGQVLSLGISEGEEVEEGRVAISIADTAMMKVEARIDSANVAFVQPGTMCEVIVYGREGELYLMGTVESVSLEGKNEDGMNFFPATIMVDNAGGEMRNGMQVEYTLTAAQSEDCILIPAQAVKYTEAGTCVLIKAETAPENALDPETLGLPVPEGFYPVPITIGLSDRTNVEVVEGIEDGTEVFVQFMTDQGDSYSENGGMTMPMG